MERLTMHSNMICIGILLAGVVSSQGCAAPEAQQDLFLLTDAQMEIRSRQTRTFDVTDRNATIRAVIATLQDLGFIIERAYEDLGLVTAARFAEPNYYDVVTITVTVREATGGKMSIRANVIYNNQPIEDPKVYQNFFVVLQRALFLPGESNPSS
ncbi:MAG: hypothetical protein P0119_17610 [Nitrospira sp.]|nr:hypothetical protein [Nitrospira sp.]